MIDARGLLGTHDVLFVTLDTLRFDVAEHALKRGQTPGFAALIGAWEPRHSPSTFTYAAHHAFFAGFLPTPVAPGKHPRLFSARFAGSETTTEQTLVFDAADIVTGFSAEGYRTVCIGGVGFFNQQNPLGCVLPALFDESHWSEALGVTDARSTEHQVDLALSRLSAAGEQRVFMFVNVSAIHQPNRIFASPVPNEDDVTTMAAALHHVDTAITRLVTAMRKRAPLLAIFTSDHGTAYGEDGYHGHRLGHPIVWTVPYAECVLA